MYTFKMYFTGNQEQFEYDPWGGQGASATQKTLPYLESLLSFLELDCIEVERSLREILDSWDAFFSTGDNARANSAFKQMGALTSLHIYFRLPYLQWFDRRAQGTLDPEMTKKLLQLLEQLPMYQRQAQTFLERVLDIDQAGRATQQNARRQYRFDQPRDPELFQFEAIPVSFGPVDSDTCGLILQPNTVRDLIDFSLRECVMKGIPVRRCRNCGRYFPLTGRITAEYCERPNLSRKPCRNTGAAQKWEDSRKDNAVFREYRREYKRRFAWIKAGKISVEEFTAWSKRAQEKKKECDNERIALDEFKAWLRDL